MTSRRKTEIGCNEARVGETQGGRTRDRENTFRNQAAQEIKKLTCMTQSQSVMTRICVILAALAWTGFAIWLFGFSFSDHYFEYSLPSRLPPFLAALFSALVIPVSGARQFLHVRRTQTTRVQAWFTHAIVTALSILPLMLTSALLSRAPEPWKLSGDDAMGVGIDFLFLSAIAIFSILLLTVALAFTSSRTSKL